MSFTLSDQHVEDFHTLGYTVFEQILPATLIRDLRLAADLARDLAREKAGAQTQRLQPVGDFDIEQQPFIDYAELPELLDAIHQVLSPAHTHGDRQHLGILLEPADLPYCTHWHRDWRDNIYGLDLDQWETNYRDPDLLNQVNCALYEDSSTWVVPGSHLRRDLAERADLSASTSSACRGRGSCIWQRGISASIETPCGTSATTSHTGDVATLHDSVYTPAYREWSPREVIAANERRAAGAEMSNPNFRN